MSRDTHRDSTAHAPARLRGVRRPLFALGWMLLIFGTSCTVVRPDEFFRWIHANLLHDDRLFGGFQVFWGTCWFAVVKGWHATEFAVLYLLCLAALNRAAGGSPRRNATWAILIAVTFAATDEWHQTFVPGRGGTATDVLIDSLGVFAAALVSLRRITAGRKRGLLDGSRFASQAAPEA
jgi:hypothetical protein